jgi:ParB/RepB/Spo0J family partition protein
MFQFRKKITPESVAALSKSLAEEGQKFPIVLWLRNTGERVTVAGLRRLSAAISLKWNSILAITIPESEADYDAVLKLNFIENVERKTLSKMDIMFACKKLKDKGETNESIGKLIGKNERTVRRYIGIAELPEIEQDKVKSGYLAIRNAGSAGIGTRADSALKNVNMYVKSTKSGFCATLKYDRKHDNPEQALAFLAELQKQIKEQVKLAQKEAQKASRKAKSGKAGAKPPPAGGTIKAAVPKPIFTKDQIEKIRNAAIDSAKPETIKGIIGLEKQEGEIAKLKKALEDQVLSAEDKAKKQKELQYRQETLDTIKKMFNL